MTTTVAYAPVLGGEVGAPAVAVAAGSCVADPEQANSTRVMPSKPATTLPGPIRRQILLIPFPSLRIPFDNFPSQARHNVGTSPFDRPPSPIRLSRRSGNPEPSISIDLVGIHRTPRLSAKETSPVWTTPALSHVFGCGKGLWIPASARKTAVVFQDHVERMKIAYFHGNDSWWSPGCRRCKCDCPSRPSPYP